MSNILNIIKDRILTYEQKVIALARAAENSIDVLKIDKDIQDYRDLGIICDLFEGNAPYRPRYILPDYSKILEKGSEFLELKQPEDIWDAVNNLLIVYRHVPSITSFPVFIGNVDTLLEPFINDEDEGYWAIKFFFKYIDRTITDSFCHGNIGPRETRAGRIILKVVKELQTSVPNLTLKYGLATSDDFALQAVETSLQTAKPSFANHQMFLDEFGESYGIASCYNGLSLGGGSFTLVRLNLAKLAKKAEHRQEFMQTILPDAVQRVARYMDERIKFLVEESGFFESNFLVKEGFIDKSKFSAMFGMVGLAECVNHFMDESDRPENRFGYSKEANRLGFEILTKLEEEVKKHSNSYCEATNGKFMLHAQVGIDTDTDASPGCRIPIGEEPELFKHILQAAPYHKFFPSGIGDIFKFDTTTKNNPQYVLDIIKGAFKENMRYISFYCADCDVIRVTGYLVKRSEMEKLDAGQQVLRDTVVLGLGATKNQRILERKEHING